MSFSFLGGLASLLPGYIQGQRMANQDNWQDLMNYNTVQSGQLSNAFTEATWQNRLNMMADQDVNSALQAYGNTVNARLIDMMRPFQEMQASAMTYYAPLLAGIVPRSQLMQWDMMQNNPNLMRAMMGGGTGRTPSIFQGQG